MDEIPINQIKPSPYQLRLSFKTEDLKQEIQRDGLLSPLIVRRKDGFYEIIDGQRRFETLKELGWKKVPVEIQQVDDKKARLMVYKLNSIRESYSVEEKARYFKKLYDEGMTFYQIGKELNVDDSWVLAHINVFKFPEDIQSAVWSGELSISHVQRLEPVIGANMEEATKVAKEVLFRRISVSQTEELVKDRKEAVEKARVEAAKRAIGVMTPIAEVKLETPEDFERAATALKKEAMKKREQTLTPEDKTRIEVDRRYKEEERRKRAEKTQQIMEERVRTKVEQEVRTKATEELLRQPDFVRQLIKRPEVRQALEETRKVETPPQKLTGYLTLEEPLPVQYQHQREWNLKQLVGRELNKKELTFDFVTIGYSQKTVQDLISLLKLAKVTLLVDVRRNPQSMYKPEFNKDKLEKELTGIGVEYIHMPQLGIPREARDEVYEGSVTPKELLEQYEKEVLRNREGLQRLLENVKGKGTFALLCTEIDPTMCHRHKIAQALIEKGMMGYDL
jgi:ParB family chromosome partitioning protein